jgi:hypothetical protein
MLKKVIFTLTLCLLSISLGSGESVKLNASSSKTVEAEEITNIKKDVKGFHSIDIRNAMNADITISDVEEVIVKAGENLHQYIVVEVVNNVLQIYYNKNINVKGKSPKIHIKMKDLQKLTQSGATKVALNSNEFKFASLNCDISGASKFSTNNLFTNTLNLELSGASTFISSILTAKNCDFDCSGASRIILDKGTCEKLQLNLSGMSSFKNYEFVSQYAELDLSGMSAAELTIEKELVVEASGMSSCYYKGNAVAKNSAISGMSSFKKK